MKVPVQYINSPSYKRLSAYKREQRKHQLSEAWGVLIIFLVFFLVAAAILGGWNV